MIRVLVIKLIPLYIYQLRVSDRNEFSRHFINKKNVQKYSAIKTQVSKNQHTGYN